MSRTATRKPQVLLVDDDSVNRRVYSRMLTKQCGVVTAEDAAHALALLASQHFDAVLTEQEMAPMTGSKLLEQVRYRYPDVRRILMSASGIPDLDRLLDCGTAQVFLRKPLDPISADAAIRGYPL